MLNAAAILVVAKVRRDIRQFMGELLWLFLVIRCVMTRLRVRVNRQLWPGGSRNETAHVTSSVVVVYLLARRDRDADHACDCSRGTGIIPGEEAQAEAAIVIGPDSGPFYRWVASEVQRYVPPVERRGTADRDGGRGAAPTDTHRAGRPRA